VGAKEKNNTDCTRQNQTTNNLGSGEMENAAVPQVGKEGRLFMYIYRIEMKGPDGIEMEDDQKRLLRKRELGKLTEKKNNADEVHWAKGVEGVFFRIMGKNMSIRGEETLFRRIALVSGREIGVTVFIRKNRRLSLCSQGKKLIPARRRVTKNHPARRGG